MRVMLMHSRPIDFVNHVGGFPEFLKAIMQEYRHMGLDFIVYGGSKKYTEITQLEDNVFNGPIVEPAFFYSRQKLKTVVEFCKQQQITLIHSQGVYTPGFMAGKIFEKAGIPYVLTSHSDLHPGNSERLRRRRVQSRCRAIIRDAAFVTHLSPVMQEAAWQIEDCRAKSKIIHNGIDWKKSQISLEKKYLFAIGRLTRGKGFHVLIDMFAELLKQGVNTSLVIAGTGEAEKELQQQCQNLSLNTLTHHTDWQHIPEKSVIFAGYVRGDLKQQLMSECQCVLFATQPDLWEEAFGIVQLEAMAAGKPLVASDISIVRYLSDLGMRAIIVPPKDIAAWVYGVKQLLDDEVLRKSMGQANERAVEAFSWRGVAKEYASVYGNIPSV